MLLVPGQLQGSVAETNASQYHVGIWNPPPAAGFPSPDQGGVSLKTPRAKQVTPAGQLVNPFVASQVQNVQTVSLPL